MSFGEFKMESISNAQQPSMFEQIMTEVRRGMEHKNQGTSMGLPKLEGVIDGVTKSNYTLIVSNSGSGNQYFLTYIFFMKVQKFTQKENIKNTKIIAVYMRNHIQYYRSKTEELS